jgi:hypothetical protein
MGPILRGQSTYRLTRGEPQRAAQHAEELGHLSLRVEPIWRFMVQCWSGHVRYPSCDSGCAPWSRAIPRRPRALRGDTEGVRDHVARDQRAVEHQIDRRRQLGGVRRPYSFALSRCPPQEPPTMVFEPAQRPEVSCLMRRGIATVAL